MYDESRGVKERLRLNMTHRYPRGTQTQGCSWGGASGAAAPSSRVQGTAK